MNRSTQPPATRIVVPVGYGYDGEPVTATVTFSHDINQGLIENLCKILPHIGTNLMSGDGEIT